MTNTIALQVLLGELERDRDRCTRGLIQTTELTDILKARDKDAVAALDPASDGFRIWERRKRERPDWREQTVSGFASARDAESLSYRAATLRQILDSLSPEFLRDSEKSQEQYYFEADEVFRARQRLFSVLSGAAGTVAIYDPYFDVVGLDFIAALEPAIHARILTAKASNLFGSQFRELAKSREGLEARTCGQSHDRWVIIDGAVVWHLGASINGIGKKAFLMSRVSDSVEASRIIASFEEWWTAGATIL